MIIDSADGDSHMILENMEAWEARENDVVVYDQGRQNGFVIGTFASHKRAQQVAWDIEIAYRHGDGGYQMPPDEEPEEE